MICSVATLDTSGVHRTYLQTRPVLGAVVTSGIVTAKDSAWLLSSCADVDPTADLVVCQPLRPRTHSLEHTHPGEHLAEGHDLDLAEDPVDDAPRRGPTAPPSLRAVMAAATQRMRYVE